MTLTLMDKAFALKGTTLFATLDLEMLLAVADKADVIVFDDGDTVFKSGQDANRIFVMVEGEVEAEGERLHAPDFFGDEAIFNGGIRKYGVISRGKVTVLTLARTTLLAAISESPSVAISLVQAYAQTTEFRKRSRTKKVRS